MSFLVSLATPVLEANILPDFVVRKGIRKLLKERKKGLERDTSAAMQYKTDFVSELKSMDIAICQQDANVQHYEVPPEFYLLSLGKRLKYSSCFFAPGVKDTDLEAAEETMLKLTCARAELADGMEVLDIGCGWGSLSLWICENYPNCKVTSISNSRPQREFIEEQARKRGFKNLRVITADMASFDFPEDERPQFDRALSVEMFEHMKNYEKLLGKISTWLKPEGKLFVHIFTHKSTPYHFETDGDNDWMAANFFTGGTMPSDDLLFYFQKDLHIVNHWIVDGTHYSKTCECWLRNMDKNTKRIREIFAETYGAKNVTKWIAYWRIFFMSCSELFNFDGGNEWVVSHYLFQKK